MDKQPAPPRPKRVWRLEEVHAYAIRHGLYVFFREKNPSKPGEHYYYFETNEQSYRKKKDSKEIVVAGTQIYLGRILAKKHNSLYGKLRDNRWYALGEVDNKRLDWQVLDKTWRAPADAGEHANPIDLNGVVPHEDPMLANAEQTATTSIASFFRQPERPQPTNPPPQGANTLDAQSDAPGVNNEKPTEETDEVELEIEEENEDDNTLEQLLRLVPPERITPSNTGTEQTRVDKQNVQSSNKEQPGTAAPRALPDEPQRAPQGGLRNLLNRTFEEEPHHLRNEQNAGSRHEETDGKEGAASRVEQPEFRKRMLERFQKAPPVTNAGEKVLKIGRLLATADRMKANIALNLERLTDGTPSFPLLPKTIQVPGATWLDPNGAKVLDQICREATQKFNRAIIDLQEQALDKIKGHVLGLCEDWNPTAEEESEIYQITNKLTEDLRKTGPDNEKKLEPFVWFTPANREGKPGIFLNSDLKTAYAKGGKIGKGGLRNNPISREPKTTTETKGRNEREPRKRKRSESRDRQQAGPSRRNAAPNKIQRTEPRKNGTKPGRDRSKPRPESGGYRGPRNREKETSSYRKEENRGRGQQPQRRNDPQPRATWDRNERREKQGN